MKREEGWYWVKWDNNSGWIIGHYRFNKWWIGGYYDGFKDNEFKQIDETPITRKTNEPTTKGTDTTIS